MKQHTSAQNEQVRNESFEEGKEFYVGVGHKMACDIVEEVFPELGCTISS
jgi:hypothetical protein